MEFKVDKRFVFIDIFLVLIESDWNLKQKPSGYHGSGLCINRIRLEFKEQLEELSFEINTVLIESDWNLKTFTGDGYADGSMY